jgi:hypothetical protein
VNTNSRELKSRTLWRILYGSGSRGGKTYAVPSSSYIVKANGKKITFNNRIVKKFTSTYYQNFQTLSKKILHARKLKVTIRKMTPGNKTCR